MSGLVSFGYHRTFGTKPKTIPIPEPLDRKKLSLSRGHDSKENIF